MIEQLLGIDSDVVIIGLTLIAVILLTMVIIIMIKLVNLEKNYQIFMTGKNAKNLEDVLVTRLNQVDDLMERNSVNEAKADRITGMMAQTFQKMGLVRYNALEEMGGKLSFTLALLNEKNDGFILNAVHSREGCYTYIKEVLAGNGVTALSKEEKEALTAAKEGQNQKSLKKVKKVSKKGTEDSVKASRQSRKVKTSKKTQTPSEK